MYFLLQNFSDSLRFSSSIAKRKSNAVRGSGFKDLDAQKFNKLIAGLLTVKTTLRKSLEEAVLTNCSLKLLLFLGGKHTSHYMGMGKMAGWLMLLQLIPNGKKEIFDEYKSTPKYWLQLRMYCIKATLFHSRVLKAWVNHWVFGSETTWIHIERYI